MSRFETSMPGTYFEELYARDGDPWRFAASPYEREKYAATLSALPRQRYASAFEVGCSIGVLTQLLAERCETLLAVDVAKAALDQARARCAPNDNVAFELMHVPGDWPARQCDLIVLSEVVYYLDAGDVDILAAKLTASATPGCDIVLVHWTGATNYPLSGDEAACRLIEGLGPSARIMLQSSTDAYRLDVLRSAEPSDGG